MTKVVIFFCRHAFHTDCLNILVRRLLSFERSVLRLLLNIGNLPNLLRYDFEIWEDDERKASENIAMEKY